MDLITEEIAHNIAGVRQKVAAAAQGSGRRADEITIVAVSKTFPVDVLRRAIEAGATDLGENRAQELKEKVSVLGDRARWHFVGNLQTNKVRHVVGKVTLIHSVDRYGLAEAIGRRATAIGVVQPVLLEVNVSGESNKHGCEPSRALHLADEIARIEGLDLKGVMAMAPLSDDPEDSRPFFVDLRGISQRLAADHPAATEISMGMTRDFEVAVQEGATMVRIGEAIFGGRRR